MSFCPFCDTPFYLENETCTARFDIYPVSPGHTLVTPKRHVETWFDMNEQEQVDAMRLVSEVKALLDKEHKPDGYNIGVNCGVLAGQSVPHAHVHVMPRYKGDMEDPAGGVRGVIPEKQKY